MTKRVVIDPVKDGLRHHDRIEWEGHPATYLEKLGTNCLDGYVCGANVCLLPGNWIAIIKAANATVTREMDVTAEAVALLREAFAVMDCNRATNDVFFKIRNFLAAYPADKEEPRG